VTWREHGEIRTRSEICTSRFTCAWDVRRREGGAVHVEDIRP
jgi:hypothetical protein